MNKSKSNALKSKLGKIKDYFTGTSRIDNYNNPDSALGMRRLKEKNTLPRNKQPKSLNVY